MMDPIIYIGFELGDDGWTDDPIQIDMSTFPTKEEVYKQFCHFDSLYRKRYAALITASHEWIDFEWHTLSDTVNFSQADYYPAWTFDDAFNDFWESFKYAIEEYVKQHYANM